MQMNIDLAKEIIGNILSCGAIDFENEAWDFICKELEAVKTPDNSDYAAALRIYHEYSHTTHNYVGGFPAWLRAERLNSSTNCA